MFQADRRVPERGYFCCLGQMLGQGVFQRELSLIDEIGQQESRHRLGHRTNFEGGLTIEGTRAGGISANECPRHRLVNQRGGDTSARPIAAPSLFDHRPERRFRNGGRRRGCCGRRLSLRLRTWRRRPPDRQGEEQRRGAHESRGATDEQQTPPENLLPTARGLQGPRAALNPAYLMKSFNGRVPAFSEVTTSFDSPVAPVSLKCVPSDGFPKATLLSGRVL